MQKGQNDQSSSKGSVLKASFRVREDTADATIRVYCNGKAIIIIRDYSKLFGQLLGNKPKTKNKIAKLTLFGAFSGLQGIHGATNLFWPEVETVAHH